MASGEQGFNLGIRSFEKGLSADEIPSQRRTIFANIPAATSRYFCL